MIQLHVMCGKLQRYSTLAIAPGAISHPVRPPYGTDTDSSDDENHYEPIEQALRLYVDAWNAEAALWTRDIAKDDWNHWCVPAIRQMIRSTMGWSWQECQRTAVQLCSRAWSSWGVPRYHNQQRMALQLQQNPHEWATHMVDQIHRLTRARTQLEQMGRVNCHPRDPTRIPTSELQSLAVIERTRLGRSQLGPARPAPDTTRELSQPSTGLWTVHTPQPAEDPDVTHPVDGAPPADEHDSDSTSLFQSAIFSSRRSRPHPSTRPTGISCHHVQHLTRLSAATALWRLQPHSQVHGSYSGRHNHSTARSSTNTTDEYDHYMLTTADNATGTEVTSPPLIPPAAQSWVSRTTRWR